MTSLGNIDCGRVMKKFLILTWISSEYASDIINIHETNEARRGGEEFKLI